VKVLIIDDSALVRERIARMLSEVTTVAAVAGAADWGQALEMLRSLDPDLVILDLNLAGRSGLDLLPQLKSKKPAPLVIVFTNHSGPEYANRCRELGADFFFDKSTEFELAFEVLRAARAWMTIESRGVGQKPTDAAAYSPLPESGARRYRGAARSRKRWA